ncbi:unnamed protein product [Microthlaspi erraticum]|uniref:F-box associated beta-propeller type 3 domain-containing protein n=1 Tax=Microthlaspi erraticum TaxID=1685480 RepID=A0A6D2L400_9BRAS|nr:unnamed protein product [Microthlaspi erraticum]
MIRVEDYDFIPMDLILDEIFPKLPVKSMARFRCVSKQCRSMPIRPRLLFSLKRDNGEFLIFSSPQPQQKPYEKSLVVYADFHTRISTDVHPYSYFRGLASRLIYFYFSPKPLICNPITGEYASLPELDRYRNWDSFLGFDSIDKQFKVLSVGYPYSDDRDKHRIMTLKTGKMTWRKIKCRLTHKPLGTEGICINGVLYYFLEAYRIVCFYVRSEVFKFVDANCFRVPQSTKLINYKGKLCGVELTYDDDDAVVLTMWVLENVDKQEWSKYVYTFPESEVFVYDVFVVGMTGAGEIVLSGRFTSKPFYVFYFNPERNTLQAVEVRGVGEYSEAFESDCRVHAFVDYEVDSKLEIIT